MRKIFTLLLFVFFLSNVFAQTCGGNFQTSFYGTTQNGFKQCAVQNTYPTIGDSATGNLMAFSWTDNSHGNPNFNGRVIFSFDLSAIPVNAIINSASLYLFANPITNSGAPNQPTYGNNNVGLLQKVTNTWLASSTTWNAQPATNTGDQKILAKSTSTLQNYVVNITDFVSSWVANPNSNYGMLLKMQTESSPYNSLIFYSGNVADSVKIRIDVNYSLPTSVASLTVNGTETNSIRQYNINNTNANTNDSQHTDLAAFTWSDNAHSNPDFLGRSVIRYDISSLPSNAIVNSAKLYLFPKKNSLSGVAGQPTYGTNNAGLLQRISTTWNGTTITWNNQPAVEVSSQKILPQSTTTAQQYVIDIEDFIEFWKNKPDSNFGMMFRMKTESNPYNSLLMASFNAPDSLRPRLEICYSFVQPITLKDFRGALNNHSVKLWWNTVNEINASKIIVERSYNGVEFVKITSLQAQGKQSDNYYQAEDYVDNVSKVFYRLKMVDKDGSYSYSYSNLIFLFLKVNKNGLVLAPNPVDDFTQVSFSAMNESISIINLIDATGKIVYTKNVGVRKGINTIALNDLEKLSKGFYVAQLLVDNEIVMGKFIKK